MAANGCGLTGEHNTLNPAKQEGRPRIYDNKSQKTLMWDSWKAGDSF